MTTLAGTTLAGTTLAVDLGKTSCRARVLQDGETIAEGRGVGSPGLADQNGAALAFDAITDALTDTGVAAGVINRVGIGAAGVEAASEATRELIELVRARTDAPVAVITDALAAHAGAFGGGPGVILIAGTGAVCFAVSATGDLSQIDGWGPWLGDDGSGRWVGQEGLKAVLRAYDGRGPATTLTADAAALAGSVRRLPLWVSSSGPPARRLGSFAPTVLAHAERGDAAAVGIVADATGLLARAAAASGSDIVCLAGGLSEHPYFVTATAAALAAVQVRLIAPLGDALAGAALIASTTTTPYEERIARG